MTFRKPRGSALSLALILSIVLTALIASMAWLAGESAQRTGSLSKSDQAFFAAEAGAQRMQWYCRNNKLASAPATFSGSVNGFTYTVTWSTVSGSTILVNSVGTAGNTSYALSQKMSPPNGAAVLSAGGNFDNHNIDVTGDVNVGGTYTNGGNGSLTGSLTYYGSATNTGAVSGTVTHAVGTFQSIDMTQLETTLIAAAGPNTFATDQTNTTFDFTTLAGTNKVIVVYGNVTSPHFNGTGTLYATGTITTDGYGTAANLVNLIAKGDITTSNGITIFGSLYTGGIWHRSKFTMTGMVYAAGGVENSNFAQSTLTQGSAPWFDPRASTWTATASVTDFTGPMP